MFAMVDDMATATVTTPRAAAIYCRISSDPGETRLGVERQEADCRALAERKGWPVVDVLVDNDLSAASGKPRPQYHRLLEAIDAGEVDAVVTWDLDRLHRRPIELEEFFNACDRAGVRHLASVGGDVDLASGEGVMVARIKGAVAAEEVRKIQARTRRKKLEIAEAGRPSGGGRRPFGFEADMVTVREPEAAAIREAAKRVIAGEPLRAIARDWNEQGPRPVGGNIWRTNAIHKVLCAPRTAGLRQHQGEVIGAAAWPAILDRSTWETVCAVLKDPSRRTNANARTYLLSGGLARCARCDVHMVGKPHRPGQPAYACLAANGGCGANSILAKPLEDLVTNMVLEAIDSPALDEARRALAGEAQDDPTDAIVVVEAKLAELAEMWAAGEITRAEWVTARKPLEARLEAAKRTLSRKRGTTALAAFSGRPGALRMEWDALSFDRQRAIIAAVVDRVNIGLVMRGRNTFDPSRVEVVWRA